MLGEQAKVERGQTLLMSVNRSKAKQKRSSFKVYIELPLNCPRLCLNGLTSQTKLNTLKTRLDKDAGLLPEMYSLSYLDAAPLEDESTLEDNDVISGATLQLQPWRSWMDLLRAAYLGDIKECFACSVNVSGNSSWNKYCAWVALYIASHRGHHVLVAKLLECNSLAINTLSSCGRTALHAAARSGHWKTLCVLLDNGADVRIKDSTQSTAFDLARQYGHKKCEDSLNFCQWNLQKHHITKERKTDYDASNARRASRRVAHQYADSSLVPGFRGTQGQVYMVHTPNPVTVRDVKIFEKEKASVKIESVPTADGENEEDEEKGKKLEFNYGWFDPLRAQRLIPSTHDVLTYCNPSLCQLRPKSVLNPGGYVAKKSPPRNTCTLSGGKLKGGGAGIGT